MPDPLADQGAAESRSWDQNRRLPRGWRTVDRAILRLTEVVAFAIGAAFAAMITLEVVSRYLFDFSIAIINAASKMLLVWFFLLGAGLALRQGAHVGFELLMRSLPGRYRKAVVAVGQALTLTFFVLMLWSGLAAVGATLRQTESGLGVSLAWGTAAVPTGFALLIYHLAVLAWVNTRRAPGEAEPR